VDLPGIEEIADPRSAAWRDGDAWLAGGTWLFSEPQPSLRRLLDLRAFGWPSLTAGPRGLEIAATATLAELAAMPAPWRSGPLIGQCCAALLGSFKIWNAATVGGNLCLALPAGPMISLTAALDGTCVITDRDGSERSTPVMSFVTGAGRCALSPGDLLRCVRIPAAVLEHRTAFRQVSLSAVGRSAAVVIGRLAPAGETAAGETVITVTAATTRPVQLRFPEPPSPDELLAALAAARPRYHDDVHGAPAWRAAMTRRLALEVRAELAAPWLPAR
jgi:CO/xanthine dehydrogenase FAD-binding subunit